MGELHGDEMRREYEKDGPRLWRLEDGEQHWWIANRAWRAVREHEGQGAEFVDHPSETLEVSLVPPDSNFTLGSGDDGLPEGLPDYFRIVKRDPRLGTSAAIATAAEWAWFYREEVAKFEAFLLASTVT